MPVFFNYINFVSQSIVILNAALQRVQDKLREVKHALSLSKGIPETKRLASKVRYPGFHSEIPVRGWAVLTFSVYLLQRISTSLGAYLIKFVNI